MLLGEVAPSPSPWRRLRSLQGSWSPYVWKQRVPGRVEGTSSLADNRQVRSAPERPESMFPENLEKRVIAIEAEVADLKAKLATVSGEDVPW